MKKLELGAGNNRREMEEYYNTTVDIVGNPDVKCNLGFEELPFKNDVYDLVQAFDVLEHIPKVIWDALNKRRTPFIFLMNEIYRVLKPNCSLIIETPISDSAYRRDPTHCNHLAEDWYHYFKKENNLYYDQGLVTCNFSLISNVMRPYMWSEKDIMRTELKAIKKIEPSI